MKLIVTNNWINAYDVPAALEKVLDQDLRYCIVQQNTYPGAPTPPADNGWDGWVRLYRKGEKGASMPTGLLGRVVRRARQMGVDPEIVDKRERPALGQPAAGPIPLYDYQTDAVERAVLAGRGVIDLPPRSGKTRLVAEVARRIALPCIWVAPTDRIVKQTVATLVEFFGADKVIHLIGNKRQEEAARTPLVVVTTPTAGTLSAEFYASRQLLVVDEWHHAAAASYRKLFKACAHVYFRFGMTGTHFRSGDDDLAMHALLSNTVYKLSSRELVDKGRLVPMDVIFVPTRFAPLHGVNSSDFIGGFGKYGVFEHVGRNQLVAHTAAFLARHGRKVLVLIHTKAQGRMVLDILRPLLPPKSSKAQFERVEFVSTDVPRRRIDAIMHSYNSLTEIQVLIGTSLIGEGTDLPVADALVYAASGRAEVVLLQNAFRVCTALEGKPKRALLIDFGDRHHPKLMNHSRDRLEVFYGEEIFSVQVKPTPRAVGDWLRQNGHIGENPVL